MRGLTKRQPSVRVDQVHVAAREAALGLEHHERRAGHRLHAAGEHQVALADHDRARAPGSTASRPGGAEAVHGHARDLDAAARRAATAMRATLRLSSPAALVQPKIHVVHRRRRRARCAPPRRRSRARPGRRAARSRARRRSGRSACARRRLCRRRSRRAICSARSHTLRHDAFRRSSWSVGSCADPVRARDRQVVSRAAAPTCSTGSRPAPTRIEIELELDDIDQMLEAQNERRRRSGRPELTEEDMRAEVDAASASASSAPRPTAPRTLAWRAC